MSYLFRRGFSGRSLCLCYPITENTSASCVSLNIFFHQYEYSVFQIFFIVRNLIDQALPTFRG